jgi:hypothetical protein
MLTRTVYEVCCQLEKGAGDSEYRAEIPWHAFQHYSTVCLILFRAQWALVEVYSRLLGLRAYFEQVNWKAYPLGAERI